MIGLAAVPGLATGLAAPVAAARLRTQGAAENGIAARVANADAIGSAAAGLLFALMLSPLLGHWAAWPIALSAAVLAGLCACPARRVRSAAVLVCGLAVAGIGLAVWLPGVRTAAGAAAKPAPPAPAATPAASRPVVPLPPGNLSDHTAEFWEPE
jgi:predicted membrane-bound spermidine synthase